MSKCFLYVRLLAVLMAPTLVAVVSESSAEDKNTHEKDLEIMTDKSVATATFAGGCFWCMQPEYDQTEGVVKTVVGYTGGANPNPTYEEVSQGNSGHIEAIEVTYDPSKVSYEKLLDIYWSNIDPTDDKGQFADRGSQYMPAVFVHDQEQRSAAEVSRKELGESGRFSKPIVVEILDAAPFYPAEDYHQKYYEKAPLRYKSYKYGSGRAPFLEKVWGADR